jgi:hypothetical protein
MFSLSTSLSPGGDWTPSSPAPAVQSRIPWPVGTMLRTSIATPTYSWLPLLLALLSIAPSSAQESGDPLPVVTLGSLVQVTFEENKALRKVSGELVALDKTFGQLILDADGQLTAVSPSALKRVEELTGTLTPTSAKDLSVKALAFMPAGSKAIITEHFVVCYNTSDAYARWNANLYERLYKGFYRFWKQMGVELNPPRFPMLALVFETKDDYVNYARKEFEGAENTIGYYHQSTNRLASYDLTGIEGMIPAGAQVVREELINQVLSRPEAERTVATIVHEACHQISFNSGLQVRLGDNPLWLSEGLATFFEAPDLTSQNGWGGIGKVNWHNYQILSRYLPNRNADSLSQLLLEDARLRQGDTLTNAYAEAWGLTYYLIKSKPKQFATYIKSVREKQPGNQSGPKERMELFQRCFGEDIGKLDKDLVRFLQKVR